MCPRALKDAWVSVEFREFNECNYHGAKWDQALSEFALFSSDNQAVKGRECCFVRKAVAKGSFRYEIIKLYVRYEERYKCEQLNRRLSEGGRLAREVEGGASALGPYSQSVR